MIIERHGNKLKQVFEGFDEPTPTQPLKPSVVKDKQRDTYLAYNCRNVSSDVHEFASFCEILIPSGIAVVHAPSGANGMTSFAYCRDLMRSGQLDVLPETAKQLKRVGTKADGGPKLTRAIGSGHCDLVSALVAAVWLDRRFGQLGGGASQRPGTVRGSWTT